MEITSCQLPKRIGGILIGVLLPICTVAQDVDPCKFNRIPVLAKDSAETKRDIGKSTGKFGFVELEFKPDFNFSYGTVPTKRCKLVANVTNRMLWNFSVKKTKVELLAEQRLGGILAPDSLRNLSNDEMRVQINLMREATKPMRPSPAIQTEVKTALFSTAISAQKSNQATTTPRGFLLPATAILSSGVKAEKPGKGLLTVGIAGLKIDWLHKNGITLDMLTAYPNLIAPSYRTINGGMHFTTTWSCALGKNLKFEHTSRIFKTLFPSVQKPDIELRHALVFTHAKGLQTSLRQSYTINQSLGTPADFSGEVVMGYLFIKQAGKKQ